MTTGTEVLLTKKEAAAAMKTSIRTIDRLTREKKLAVVYLGPLSPRFTPADVQACIEKLRNKGA